MSPAVQTAEATILLLGNPNTGKSSLFSAVTGARQRVANFPGVTVEAKLGPWRLAEGTAATLVDLPGCYSLAARSPDERIASDALLGHLMGVPPPDAVMLVVDASCLERNLYLATQVLEHDVPVVIALTMGDVAAGRGIAVDADRLAEQLGVPVVPVHVPSGRGLDALARAVASQLGRRRERRRVDFPEDVEAAVAGMADIAPELGSFPVALRVLVDGPERAPGTLAGAVAGHGPRIDGIRAGLGGAAGLALMEAETRYRAIRRMVELAKRQDAATRSTLTDRLDAVLTHKVWGLLILTAILAFVFQAIYSWSAPAMDGIEAVFGAVGSWVAPRIPEGALRGLVVDGIIAGVGGVLVFLPQILVLFFFIAMLEDIGYMSRAAFLMDRLMSRLGLSGRSFIPLLSSFACAIPGIMGARVIEDRRSRLTTIFLAPFMSCSARLPVYALMIGAFVPPRRLGGVVELQGVVLLAMYGLGIVVAIPTALLVRRVAFQAEPTSFLLELPSYKLPQAGNVGMLLWHRAGSFVTRAGTLILSVTVLVWALGYFPRSAEVLTEHEARREETERAHRARVEALQAAPAPPEEQRLREEAAEEERRAALEAIDQSEAGELLRRSALGTLGRAVEPVVAPLGWDWRIGMAVIASFPAREVVIGTLGTIFNLGQADEKSEPLKQVLREARRPDGTPLFTLATALSLMVFFALCIQCAATLAIMKKETNSWRWPAAAFAYMTSLAYVAALVAYQLTVRLGAGA